MGKIVASVIIPTLNEEKRLQKSIESLNNQTISRDKYEIIISDSSSQDKTVSIAKKLQKKGLIDKVVVCKRQSAGFGRNYGAKLAKGEIFGFVDADTHVDNTWVEGLIETLSSGKVIACTGPLDNIEKDSLKVNLFYKWWNIQTRISVGLNYPIIPGYNFGVRKKEFWKAKGFAPENRMCEDIALCNKLIKIGKLGYSTKMGVRTSDRRQKELPLRWHIFSGIRFVFTGTGATWEEYRTDFAHKDKKK